MSVRLECGLCGHQLSKVGDCPICGNSVTGEDMNDIPIGPSLTRFKLKVVTNRKEDLLRLKSFWDIVERESSFQWKFPDQIQIDRIMKDKEITLYVINEAYSELKQFVRRETNMLSIVEEQAITLDEFEAAAEAFSKT